MRTRQTKIAAVAAAVAAMSFGAVAETTVQGNKGPSTATTPYLLPVAAGVRTVSVFTVGDTVNTKLDGVSPFRLIGIPDGMGAIDAGDGTMLVTVNHELGTGSGVVRAHGSLGACVSVLRVDKTTLEVKSADDLIRTVLTWDAATQKYVQATSAFGRFCSADVPALSAFYDAATGLGTTSRFHMNGEENGNTGRAFAHAITGPNAGVATELPWIGKQSWENVVASPFAQTKTIVVATDDSTPGQVLVYVGTKLAAGTDVQRAGLTNGKLYGVLANGTRTEDRTTGIGLAKGVAGAFTLLELPNQAALGANTETAADTLGCTEFLRPEDGAWDPSNPADFWFVTTDQFDQVKAGTGATVGRTRLWKLHFANIAAPETGGTVTMLLDGTEPGQMYDNMCFDTSGHVLLQEDVGGNAHNGKIWQFDTASGALTLIAKHDPARFGDIGLAATPPFNNDEEASGIFDASELLGPGWFILCDQTHYSAGDTELDQGGQILALWNPDSVTPPTITAAASASTTSASAGQTVTFEVEASSPGGGALTYSWNFGDGSAAAPGASVSHTYAAPGTYPAVVTVTHTASGKTATSQISVNVARPMGGLSLSVALNFATTGKDTLTLTGEVPIGAAFDPAGKQVSVDVGGIQKTFTLGANGASPPSPTETFKLALRKLRGAVVAQRAKFTMTLKKSDLAGLLADEKLTNRTVANDPCAVQVSVTFDGRTNSETLDLIYNAVLGKKGTAK